MTNVKKSSSQTEAIEGPKLTTRVKESSTSKHWKTYGREMLSNSGV